MDGRDTGGFGSYFHHQHYRHHHHNQLVDGVSSSPSSGNETFYTPSPTVTDAIQSAIPNTVSTRPMQARAAGSAPAAADSEKRKRGRPRKYGAVPSLPPLSLPTSAMPPAANASPSLFRPSASSSSRKKETSNSSSRKFQLAALGNAGQGFIPHVIAVSAGEDLVDKLVLMMQQGKRAVCILSANGSILNPSLHQPASGACVMHEGLFEIISLFGSLIHTKSASTSSRTLGLGICLSGVDGHIVGGGVEGPLTAAGPIQVIAGSFLIDIDTNFNAPTKVDGFANNLAEAATSVKLTSPVNMEPALRSSRRMASSMGGDEHQSMGGGYNLFHSGPMFSSPDWEGRHLGGSTGTNQSSDDEITRD